MLKVDREAFERLCGVTYNMLNRDIEHPAALEAESIACAHDILSLLGLQAPEQASQGAQQTQVVAGSAGSSKGNQDGGAPSGSSVDPPAQPAVPELPTEK